MRDEPVRHGPDLMRDAEERLFDAIRGHARLAAHFTCVAGNFDRPIGTDNQGRDVYDPRWYAVHAALDHFNEGLAGAVKEDLLSYGAVGFLAGLWEPKE